MTKRLVSLLLLVLAGSPAAARAQEAGRSAAAKDNIARSAALNNLSAAAAFLASSSDASSLSTTLSAPLPAASPEPRPRFVYGSRDDYRWQLSASYAYVRFRSSVFDSNLSGLNTTLVYFTNEWLGLEATVTAAFANPPSGFASFSNAKYLFYGGGPRIAWRQRYWEPFAHGAVGGLHMQPQTAAGGRDAFAFEVGGGADWRWRPRLSLRLEGDYARWGLYSQNQNNLQIAVGIVFHF